MEKDEIIKLSEGLYQQALEANCIYSMIEQYHKAKKEYGDVLGCFPAFYNLTYNAMLKACFMEIAKLYDDNSTSLGGLILSCSENINVFPEYREVIEHEIEGEKITTEVPYQHYLKKEEEVFYKEYVELQRRLFSFFSDGDVSDILVQKDFTFPELLELYQKRFNSLSKKKKNLRKQRNNLYAHNGDEIIFNDAVIIEKYPISFSDIKDLIQFALDITRMILGILTNVSRPEIYSNIEEFEFLLKYARVGVAKQKEEEEKWRDSMNVH
ncbi:hypothetical protein D6853_05785 [Butyrivibrio sp. X503]|uniref:AbiU2 domain-containing protein n=1 Tax=Butyrivibrio sp. X503 TaxID=2364878 RepID=UPI000EA97B10|nr:hypothetical protein [Butyrivibrio sp. X503]RKM56305.1 hypothetical protein D6853_05785 [Butyrivibrio sp. X503]